MFGSQQWGYSSGDYEIANSLRFNDDDSAYLSWTPSSAGNRKTWTFSCWVKRGNILGATNRLFNINGANAGFYFNSSSQLGWLDVSNSNFVLLSDAVLRDPSAWYHAVFAFDSTQATGSDRVKVWLNGIPLAMTAESGYDSFPSLNQDGTVNGTGTNLIGGYTPSSQMWDGYMAEVNFIDGQALDSSYFGETGDYGEWKPIEYTGTYGTNGFYLPFKQDYQVEGFSTVTYTGTGADQYIGGTGFQPDLTWIKHRNGTSWNHLYDSIRGTNTRLHSNSTQAESSYANSLTAFNNDGISLGSADEVNYSGRTYVAWNWDMGGSNATNTNGSITSTVRANPTYGQSIVSYTGNGTDNSTIGHGLSSAPEMIIIKGRSSVEDWMVYHKDLTAGSEIILNSTGAQADDVNNATWGDNHPSGISTSTFGIGYAGDSNGNGTTYIAYCFHSVSGYSKFGSYTGTGSSGNSITTGFRPAFVMMKRTDNASNWVMVDNVREASNSDEALFANLSQGQETSYNVDYSDTGFTIQSSEGDFNTSGGTYIYMAFADTREYAYWLDQSGNNNDWTSNNLTESDISEDSPTNNFCTWNAVEPTPTGIFAEGNTHYYANAVTTKGAVAGTMGFSGKFYWEVFSSSTNQYHTERVGIVADDFSVNQNIGYDSVAWGYGSNGSSQYKWNNNSGTYLGSRQIGDIQMIAVDTDAGKVWFGRNGTWEESGNPATGANAQYTNVSSVVRPATSVYNTQNGIDGSIANFGQDSSFAGNKTAQGNADGNGYGDFYYTPPSGFLALCTQNLPDPTVIPSEHFNTVLYTGNGSGDGVTHSITSVGFSPDLVWTKDRDSGSYGHYLFDRLRGTGVTKGLRSNTTNSEGMANHSYDALSSFDSDGFSVTGGQYGSIYQDRGGAAYVAWNWKANGSGVSNTNGTITSTVSANQDAGFSIVSYTGNATAGATVGHGLSSAPEMVIAKNRDLAKSWTIYSKESGANGYLVLDSTNAFATDTNMWNNNHPTSSVFYLGTDSWNNGNASDYIAYCFHSVDGYSKVGSYTGNGSTDGTFVYTGFRPAFILVKRTSSAGKWLINDFARDEYNQVNKELYPDDSIAEYSGIHSGVDFLSNGFKWRTTNGDKNGSGSTIIYIAFAENPFKQTNAR